MYFCSLHNMGHDLYLPAHVVNTKGWCFCANVCFHFDVGNSTDLYFSNYGLCTHTIQSSIVLSTFEVVGNMDEGCWKLWQILGRFFKKRLCRCGFTGSPKTNPIKVTAIFNMMGHCYRKCSMCFQLIINISFTWNLVTNMKISCLFTIWNQR